jgi:SAM-dependent methyltransferase
MKVHYTESRYYSLWSILVDRLVNANIKNILDVGCGPGQLALFIQDKGIPNYLGIDFSAARIAYAKKLNLSYHFMCCDAFSTDLFDSYDYDCVISLEFLEHIHKDLEIISQIRSGSRFLGTVPNFPYIAHVRHFKTQEEVYNRYSHLFQKLQVTTHLRGKEGVKYFILDGIIL